MEYFMILLGFCYNFTLYHTCRQNRGVCVPLQFFVPCLDGRKRETCVGVKRTQHRCMYIYM